MSLKLKLVLSFIVLALIGLGFSLATIYQSSIEAYRQQERSNLLEWSKDLQNNKALASLLPADRYVVIEQDNKHNSVDLLNTNKLDITKDFPYPGTVLPESDTIDIQGKQYCWSIAEQEDGEGRLVVLHQIPEYGWKQFLTKYGTEIFIIMLFTLWGVFWAALVVYSLIQRINGQKEILEQQTVELDRKRQDAIDAARTKSQFLANISHEMRTPLTAIIGYSETLLHSDQPMEERLSSINTVIRNGNHLLTLINDLLDLSKIEAGKLEVESIPVNIVQVLCDVENLFSQQAQAKGIELNHNYHFPLAKTIMSDPVRIKQIIINLVSNALKFTKSGYIHVDVQQLENGKLQLQVEDTGVGMTDKQISRLFEEYNQAEKSTSRKYGGTGLGLSLSKHLAQLLGGDITVSSLPGLGSIFTLTVDCGDISQVETINSVEEAGISSRVQIESPIAHKLRGRILLAEDNSDNQHLFSMYLKRFGIELDIAHNGQQAIEFALREHYDLILMDMQMPIMDGIEATRDLRNKGVKTPIVALTANAMKDDMDRFYSAGCDDYLTKPIKRETLYKLCSVYLQAVSEDDQQEPIISTVLEEEPDFIDIVSRFVNRLPEQIEEIRTLNNAKRFSELAKLVHDLKGVSGNMGYKQITELAGKMEFQVANRNISETNYLITQLEALNKRIQAGIQ